MNNNTHQGQVHVYTGNGKGKTTAAIGLALRATGRGLKVIMIQFLKGSRNYGEIRAAHLLAPNFAIIQMGKDCVLTEEKKYQCRQCNFACHVDPQNPSPDDHLAATNALKIAAKFIQCGEFDMVILDEVIYAVNYGLLPLAELVNLINQKPSHVHVVLTGRNAPPELLELADLVTEMKEIKHPFQKGIRCVPGVDF
jgi:cob(I)alamin adenosyltransferase